MWVWVCGGRAGEQCVGRCAEKRELRRGAELGVLHCCCSLRRQLTTLACRPPLLPARRRWQCSNAGCLQLYQRHSNSIDVSRKVCGACRAPLTFLGKFRPNGTPAKPRQPSKFALFVKENAAEIKAQLPAGTPHKEVMQRVAGMYQAARKQAQGGGAGSGASGSEGAATSVVDLTQ